MFNRIWFVKLSMVKSMSSSEKAVAFLRRKISIIVCKAVQADLGELGFTNYTQPEKVTWEYFCLYFGMILVSCQELFGFCKSVVNAD